MFPINFSDIEDRLMKGRIVAVEFQNPMNPPCRAIVKGVSGSRKVITIYGRVFPTRIFVFTTFKDADDFVNGKKLEH